MKKFLNITAIATIAMMSCACNEEAIEPSDDWKDVPVEENLTDYIYFEDGSFTTATVDFTLNQTEFSYKVIRKSENGLDCKADVTLLTEEELASEGSYYARIPAEYFEVTPSVEFTENDEAEVTVSFNADKATEVAEFITSSRNSEKSPCIAIRLDVNGDNGIVASKKAGYLIISWSYDNASACRISAELEGAERPLYIDLVPYTELPAISVNHFSSCKINVNHFSGNIVGEVKVNAAFDEAAAAEYAERNGYEMLPADALTCTGEATITSDNTSAALTFDLDRSKLTGCGLYMAAVTLTVSENAEFEGSTTFCFLIESPVSYDGLWIDTGSGIEPADAEGWASYQANNLYAPASQSGDGYLGGLFDKQGYWHWHSSYDESQYYINETYGHFVQIKLTEPISHGLRFNYWGRVDPWDNPAKYAPSKIVILYSTVENINNETSDTDGNWQELATLTREADGLPYSDWGEMYQSEGYDIEGLGNITYLRFCCMENIDQNGALHYLGKDTSDPTGIAISDMKIWGN